MSLTTAHSCVDKNKLNVVPIEHWHKHSRPSKCKNQITVTVLNGIYARTLHQLRNKQMDHVLKDVSSQENSRTDFGELKMVESPM